MTTITWQRIEGALAMAAGLWAAELVTPHWPWWSWPLLFLAPDLGMLGYLAGPRIGAACYNTVHLYGLWALAAMAGVVFGIPWLAALGALFIAHVGLDRMLSFGLKEATGFTNTHLGTIGQPPSSRP